MIVKQVLNREGERQVVDRPPNDVKVHPEVRRYADGKPLNVISAGVELHVAHHVEIGMDLELIFRAGALIVSGLAERIGLRVEDFDLLEAVRAGQTPPVIHFPVGRQFAAIRVAVEIVPDAHGHNQVPGRGEGNRGRAGDEALEIAVMVVEAVDVDGERLRGPHAIAQLVRDQFLRLKVRVRGRLYQPRKPGGRGNVNGGQRRILLPPARRADGAGNRTPDGIAVVGSPQNLQRWLGFEIAVAVFLELDAGDYVHAVRNQAHVVLNELVGEIVVPTRGGQKGFDAGTERSESRVIRLKAIAQAPGNLLDLPDRESM